MRCGAVVQFLDDSIFCQLDAGFWLVVQCEQKFFSSFTFFAKIPSVSLNRPQRIGSDPVDISTALIVHAAK